MNAETKLARAKTRLIFDQPFFGTLAFGTDFIRDDDQPTMCTNAQWIKWNAGFVEANSDTDNMFVIAHEVLHIGLHHCGQTTIDGKKADPQLQNMAMDYVINAILLEAGGVMTMPEGGLYDPKYSGMTWQEVYRILDQADEDQRPQPQPWGGDIGMPKDGDGNDAGTEQMRQMEAEINSRLTQAADVAKSKGKLPGAIAEIVTRLRKPKVRFEDVLLRFMFGDQPDDYSYRKPNKHAWHEQGLYLPTLENDGVGHIALLFDCSGSMSTPELEQGFSEVKNLIEEFTPKSVTVVQFDGQVQKVDTFFDGDFVERIDFTGRGGTRVEPAFKYLDREDVQHDQIIVFTDMGIHDYPDIAPDVPVLWVSTVDEGRYTKPPFGEITHIEVAA